MRTDSETRKDVEDELRWDPDMDAEIARDATETLRMNSPIRRSSSRSRRRRGG
jgi:hypothetical protein